MNWLYLPYVVVMIVATITALFVAMYAWRRRSAPGGVPFALLMLAAATWALTGAVEMAVIERETKILWSQLSYLGIINVGPLWFLFAAGYSQRRQWLTRRRIALLWLLPAVVLVIALTNQWHNLLWPEITASSEMPGAMLVYKHGPVIWTHVIYAYVLMLVGTIWLVRKTLHSPQLYRKQVAALLIGAAIPWTVNALYVLGINPLPGFDATPIALAATGLALTWGFFRFHILDIVPVARDTLVESMGDGLLVLDAHDRVVSLNPAACRLIGCAPAGVVGQPAEAVLVQCPELLDRYRDTVRGQAEVRTWHEDGARWLEMRVWPLYDQRQRLSGRLLMLHDITVRKQAEASLQQYARELEVRNTELDAYAHTVAHDLKNPLTTMVGFGDLLENRYQEMPQEQLIESVHYIVRSASRMLNIVDELLLLASVRQRTEVPLSPLDMAVIVAEAQDRLRDQIAERQGRIVLPAAWPVAVGYAAWVEEVWVNYISNALKYGGDPPVVELGFDEPAQPVVNQSSSDRTGEAALPGAQIRFWVKDNGPGLTPEEQQRLFTPFTRLEQARAKGYGLGLSIVRRIVEKLGGQAGVDSQVGLGSTFWFTLPVGEGAAGDTSHA